MQKIADRLRAAGFAILNDVVLNQVLVSFGGADDTRRVYIGAPSNIPKMTNEVILG